MLLITSALSFGQYLTRKMALEDLNQFKVLLEKQSSYYQVADFDFEKYYQEIERKINQKDSVPVFFLAFELEKVMSNIIDRHANIKMENFDKKSCELCNLYLPFSVASLNGNIAALKRNRATHEFEYFSPEYPFLKRVNKIDAKEFLSQNAYQSKLSPKDAKLNDGLKDLRDIGELYFKQGKILKEVEITLTNGKTDKELKLPLSSKRNWYFDIGSISYNKNYRDFYRDKNFDLSRLDKWMSDSIAYLAIPAMLNYSKNPKLESYLKSTIEKFRKAKALIVDIRGNGGGTREILNTLSGYFVQAEQSPWVANTAYVRSSQFLDEDISSIESRFLYNYNSKMLSDKDREAIDKFNKTYKTEFNVNPAKFSRPYYMVLHSGQHPVKCPVYILVNEECFSAASVFTAALKGLNNIKIAGVTTNGSSGRSKRFYLKNSNIRVKISTMLSFQRNGKTLDGNGTIPDIIIERDEKQMLGKQDSQLKKLIELIKTKHCL